MLDAPPATDIGFNVTELSDGPVGPPVTVSVAAWLETPVLAVSDDVVVVATAAVVTANDAVDAPLGTVTVAGTEAAPVLLDAKFTTTPPGPATSARVTVAVVFTPPATDVLASDRAVTLGGLTTSSVVAVAVSSVALIVAVTEFATCVVPTVNVRLIEPAGTVTVAGTVTPARLLESETTIPPVGALLDNVTVPVELLLPTTLDGATETDANRPARTAKAPVTLDAPVLAVTTTPVSVETAFVLTVKIASCEPAATVTVAGTVAAASLESRLTTMPPVGALVSRLTIPVAVLPPATPAGEMVMTETRGAVTVRSAFAAVPLDEAVMVAEAFAETAIVVIVNVALVAPSATVTLAGSVAAALLDARLTTTPPAGAAYPMLTAPVDVRPPGTVVGSSVTLTTVGAVTVSVSVAEMPFSVPVITALTGAATPTVVTVNCALVAPSTIVTVAGTPAFELLLESATVTPPTGAADDSVTVPLLDVPPGTDTGRTVRPVSCGAVTVSVPVAVRAPMVPVIVAVELVETADVSALNVTSVAPAGTVIVAGTVTNALSLKSAT